MFRAGSAAANTGILAGLLLICGVWSSSFDADWEYVCKPEHPDCHGAWESLRLQVIQPVRMTPGITGYNATHCNRVIWDEENSRWKRYIKTTTTCEINEEQIPGTGNSRGWEGTLCTWLNIHMVLETEIQKAEILGYVRHRLRGVFGPTPEYFYTSRTTYTGELDTEDNSTGVRLTDGLYSYSIVSQSKFDLVGPCIFDESLDPAGGSGRSGRVMTGMVAASVVLSLLCYM